jgi:hypothetical protein
MKECFKCKIEKPLTEFYAHKEMSDGHLNKCKECTKKDNSKNRLKNIEYYLEYDKKRDNLPHRVMARASYRKTENYRISHNAGTNKWDAFNTRKKAASTAIGNAVRDKKIEKPSNCSCCGKEANLHGHHDDYAKPLEVRWLCSSCHRAWHKEHGEGLNAREPEAA